MKLRSLLIVCLVQAIKGQNSEEHYGCYDSEVCVDPHYCQSGSIDGNTLERNYDYVR